MKPNEKNRLSNPVRKNSYSAGSTTSTNYTQTDSPSATIVPVTVRLSSMRTRAFITSLTSDDRLLALELLTDDLYRALVSVAVQTDEATGRRLCTRAAIREIEEEVTHAVKKAFGYVFSDIQRWDMPETREWSAHANQTPIHRETEQ